MRQHAGWLVAAFAICALFVGAAISGPTTPASVEGGVYNATPPTLSDAQTGVFQLDVNGNLKTVASVTVTNPTVGAAVPATANYVAGNKGGLLTGITLDASSYLNVNCQTGCSGGTFNNNADNVATSATNGQAAAWLYGWDGAAWDRLPGTSTAGLTVSGAGTAGSAAAGVVTVQGVASMTPVQVSQATASNLNATVVGTGTFVTQSVVTQGTASNLNAAVVGTGTAGSAAGGVLTVQGVASMTALAGNITQIGGNALVADDAASGTAFILPVGGKYNATLPTYADGDRTQWQSGTRGALNVTLFSPDSAGGIGVTSSFADDSTNSANRIPVQNYGMIFDGTTWDRIYQVANSMNSTGTGIQAVGQMGQCDDTSPTALTENSFGNARVDCATHAQLTTAVPSATAGGTTLYTLTLAASTNATNVKASAGQVYSISGYNMSSATPVWISVYNNAGAPTCGTAIIQQFLIPGSTTGAGFVHDFAAPKGFSSGIAFCATTGIAGTGNPAASTYVLNIDYK